MNRSSLISGSKALAIAEHDGLAYGVQPVSIPIVVEGATLPKTFKLDTDVVLKNFVFKFTTEGEGDVTLFWAHHSLNFSTILERGAAVVVPANASITLSTSEATVTAFQIIFWPCSAHFVAV